MIEPASIPEFTGDLKQLDKDVSGLRGDAITIRDGGMDVYSRFQMLEGFYKAPEADQLLSSTWPVATKADAFASDLESVADALDTLASEIRPLVKRLVRLKADAFTFVASVEGDDDWTEDEDKVDRHQQLWDDVNAAVAAFQEAERKASTTISGLVGGPKFVADDGSHTQNRKKMMYGYDLDALDQAKELPWGSPVSQTYDALDFGHHFKSFAWDGIVVDNIWGGLKGLKTLTGFDGGDNASKAWSHLGDIAGGIGQYSMKPYDMLMDWTIGEDKESPEEVRQKQAAKDFGKSLVAWDMWDENPARASGTVVFNALTLGAAPAASGIKGGKIGAAAQGAAKIGEYLDPLSAAFKVGGKATSSLPKLSELTANIRALDNAPDAHRLHSQIELSDGSRVRIEDGAFIRVDADGNPIHDTPHQEPRAEQQTSQHEGAPAQRELAEVGASSRAPGSHVGRGESASPRHDAPPSSRENASGEIPARRGTTGGVDGLDAPRSSHADLSDGSGSHHQGGSGAHGEGRGDHNGGVGRGRALTEHEKLMRRQVDRANNEPGYFEKYYKNNGNRIRLSRVDESGFTPPQLVWDARTKSWIAASDAPPPIPERYVEGADRAGDADSLSGSNTLKDLDEAAAKRHSAISADTAAEKTLQKAKETLAAHDSPANRKALDAAQAAHRPLHKAMSDAAEKYGEAIAQHHVIPERYANAKREILDGPANGNDQFDQVWRRRGGGYVVIEAKSNVKTELGARNLPNGKRVAQGTREYFDDILREMRERGRKNRNERRLAKELEDALDQGKLDYILVKGKVSGGKYAGYHMRKFDIS